MTDPRPQIVDYLPVVRGKAREVAEHYRGYVEQVDLEQEIALWWYSVDPHTLASYVTDEGLSRLRRSMFRVARAYAEKQQRGSYTEEQVRYRGSEVAALIPVALDPDGLPDGGGVDETGRTSKGNVAWGGNLQASLIDVRRALKAAAPEDVNFLRMAEHHRGDWEAMADSYTEVERPLPDSLRRRHQRIADRMAGWLNHETTDERNQAA